MCRLLLEEKSQGTAYGKERATVAACRKGESRVMKKPEVKALNHRMQEGLVQKEQRVGLDIHKASAYLNEALAYARETDKQVAGERGAALRAEWGHEFDARVNATNQFIARMCRNAGIPLEEMQVLMNPNGIKLMDAIRRAGGEVKGYARKMSPEEELDTIYADPKQYYALVNPRDPQHKLVNARVNRLLGIE